MSEALNLMAIWRASSDIKSYFDENMKLLEDENLDGLFGGNPIYTKIRDDNPTVTFRGSKAKNIMSADGLHHRRRSGGTVFCSVASELRKVLR